MLDCCYDFSLLFECHALMLFNQPEERDNQLISLLLQHLQTKFDS